MNPILSRKNLIIKLEISKSADSNTYDPILNYKRIKAPEKIYLDRQLADESLYVKKNNYLKFKCQSNLCRIKLVWGNENNIELRNIEEKYEPEKLKKLEFEQKLVKRLEQVKNKEQEKVKELEQKSVKEIEEVKNREQEQEQEINRKYLKELEQ